MSFWGWVRDKINECNEAPSLRKRGSLQDNIIAGDSSLGEKKIDFTIHFAEGGVVLQKYVYDPIKDRSYRKLFLIPEDKDVAKEVGDFVAMEIMRS